MTQPSHSNGAEDSAPREGHIVVGRIRRARGLRGEVRVEIFTDFLERFDVGNILYLDDKKATIERNITTNRGLFVKLDVIRDRTDAEKLYGRLLTVPDDELIDLPEGSYYQHQIVGMEVWSDEGEKLGIVKSILVTGSNDVYVVEHEGRKDLLLPAISDVVLDVDVEKGVMTVKLMDGLR